MPSIITWSFPITISSLIGRALSAEPLRDDYCASVYEFIVHKEDYTGSLGRRPWPMLELFRIDAFAALFRAYSFCARNSRAVSHYIRSENHLRRVCDRKAMYISAADQLGPIKTLVLFFLSRESGILRLSIRRETRIRTHAVPV